MISENGPAFPLPLHLPPGHMVQQVLDENGVLTHVIMSQPGPPPPPPPHHHMHTGYSPSPYNGLYGHPHQYHNPNVYGPYTGDTLSYSSRSSCNHTSSPTNPSQCLIHPAESNGSTTTTATSGNTSISTLSTNSTSNQQRRSPVYNTNTNSCGTTGVASNTRTLNSSGQKRRVPPSNTNTNSYVNNGTLNGSDKPQHHHAHHHSHHPPAAPLPPTHYSTFYPEMVVQPTTESIDLTSSAEYDKERQIIEKCLSKLSLPIVQDIESRSVLVRIQPPRSTSSTSSQSEYSIDFTNLIYELLLSDKGKDAKYKQVYCGDANEITLKDLKPATEYHLKVCACIDSCKGEYTNPVPFTTDQCEPDRPAPPKLLGSRLKNSMTLKWTATADNGSKVLNYILEYDEGKGREFVEVYRGIKKQYLLSKLTPATFYAFRLAAENSIGRSEFSETIRYSTLGTIPTEPDPPILVEKGVKHLTLSWAQRPIDEAFTLQMNDEANYFRNKYTGPLCNYTVTDLFRNTEYKFRLAAHNQEGQSNYSATVTYKTLPDRPDPPAKPRIKGQLQATQCRIVWDPPRDDGGADIQQYHLELEESKVEDGFHVIYNGLEKEYLLEQLTPGHSYSLRLSCSNIGGLSDPSEITQIKTPAVAPASCHPPKISGKPKANSLNLRWAYPDYDGGAPVIEFEVQVTNPDSSSRVVYRGGNLDCAVAGLLPGRPYLFQVRAFNRAGAGPWSEYLDVVSGPGVPEAPRNFLVECQSATSALISWEEGVNNGAAITEYRLEWSRKEAEAFMQLYCGTNFTYEAKGLTPVTHYFFRVQAVNSAGAGPYSMLASCVTPAAVPSAVTSVKVHAKSTSMTITWKEPSSNGSPITGYYIDIGEKELIFVSAELNEYTIEEVLPDTAYRIRVRAVNTIGPGPFSSVVKSQTKSLPPDPPRLECIAVTCNSLKLKWNNCTTNHVLSTSASVSTEPSTNTSRSITYIIEMEGRDGSFNCIYTGTTYSHKINKLQENTSYNFRICAKNDSGAGLWSGIHTFTTTKAPPNPLKAPNITEITSTSCVFNWQAHKSLGNDPISYILQLQIYRRDNDYTEIYHGELTSYRATNLEAGVDYRVRVCAIRSTNEGVTLTSPFSPATHFVLPRAEDLAAALSASRSSNTHLANDNHHSEQQKVSLINRYRSLVSRKLKSIQLFESRTLTDQQWAIVIFVGFTLLAIFIAIFANFMYSKYTNGSSISVDNASSSSSSSSSSTSFSPGIKQ
ncbi:unnamed protein product [Adineta ricciae]|uniref:Fibronectin type-III domain-containing protein n=1 Tax=Adineta ricciae TaxID=249248 RepID=A0A816CG80_ADIRI|nr:unnamed protein product [Adineta ricciae]